MAKATSGRVGRRDLLRWVAAGAVGTAVGPALGGRALAEQRETFGCSDRRITVGKALIVGNAAYRESTGMHVLRNPLRDADAVRDVLRLAGFQVTVCTDLMGRAIRDAVECFAEDQVGGDDTAVLYYAGHGTEENRENVLFGIDGRSYELGDALETLGHSVRSHGTRRRRPGATVAIIDACRGERDVDEGFVPMSASSGDYLAFSTAPFHSASDGPEGGNSPFAEDFCAVLRSALEYQGQDDRCTVARVTQEVRRRMVARPGGQTPWSEDGTTGPIYLVGGLRPTAEPTAGTVTDPTTSG